MLVVESIELEQIVRAAYPFLWALLFAAGGAWPIFRLLKRIGSRQTVSEFVPEHAKKQGTPTMGGLVILFGLFGAQLAHTGQGGASLAFAAVATLSFALIGFLDDFLIPRLDPSKRGLGWIPKLVLQIGAALVPSFTFLQTGTSADWARVALEVFVVLFFVNAFNFADGMDALAGGLLLILAVSGAAMGLATGADLSIALGMALAGAAIPFLFLNAPPARVFMGDVGSMPIGALLGWMAIDLFRHVERSAGESGRAWIALGLWALVLIAELVPVPIQIASVKLLKRRVFTKTPIHHAFEVKGIPETRIVWTFHLVQCAVAALAFFLVVIEVAGNKP